MLRPIGPRLAHRWLELACAATEFDQRCNKVGGAPGRNRTCCLMLRRHALYPVSYRRIILNWLAAFTLERPPSCCGYQAHLTTAQF